MVIAGAAGAFGSAIAAELVDRGCYVSLFDQDEISLQILVDHLAPANVHHAVFDATVETDCRLAMNEAKGRWNRIDALVNCVGVFEIVPSVQMPADIFFKNVERKFERRFLSFS